MSLDKNSLAYLHEHLHGHELINAPETLSTLVSLPATSKIESLERFQARPNLIEQKAALKSCASFCDYVNRFKNGDSAVYLDVDAGKFVAVIDHHGADMPAWGRHRATFEPKRSLQWQVWFAAHGKPLGQIEFAQLIERQLDDIYSPEPNVVLQAALQFQQNESMEFASGQNLDNGNVNFVFKKNNATATVQFPHRITLAIPIHENEADERLEARIRYTVDGNGALRFTFSFVKDPAMVLRAALVKLASEIRTQTGEHSEGGGIHHYEGALP